jgi:hypothetical protein
MASLNRTSLDRPGNTEMKIEALVSTRLPCPPVLDNWSGQILSSFTRRSAERNLDGLTNSNSLPKQVFG